MFGRSRLDEIFSRLGAVEDAFNMYAPRLAGVEHRCVDMHSKMTSVEARINHMVQRQRMEDEDVGLGIPEAGPEPQPPSSLFALPPPAAPDVQGPSPTAQLADSAPLFTEKEPPATDVTHRTEAGKQ